MSIIYSLLYTSRRPSVVQRVVELWLTRAVNPERVEFVFTADTDDKETAMAMMREVEKAKTYPSLNVLGPFPSPVPGTCVKGWNLAAHHSTGDVLIAISDDFVPPAEWDIKLFETACEMDASKGKLGWLESAWCILVPDGIVDPGQLCATLPIVTRARYDSLGYFLHPRYESMWCDNELAEHAKQDGQLLMLPDLGFRHRHYVNQKREMDAHDRKHSSKERYFRGRAIFEARKSMRFHNEFREGKFEHITGNLIAYLQVSKDDVGLLEICQRLREQYVGAFFFSVPLSGWDGKPSNLQVVEEVAEIMSKENRVEVYLQKVRVKDYIQGEDTIIDCETRVRNSALSEIFDIGYRHVLIVDGDELWREGLAEKVVANINSSRPAYISTGNIPVVCGYPVEGAKDGVGIYIDAARNRFIECRKPYQDGPQLPGPNIIHFTATRKTQGELVAKMRSSGHYDDPDYAFENWIAGVMPNIKPGFRNAHMYQRGENIWPLVRNWTQAELGEMPEQLRALCRT